MQRIQCTETLFVAEPEGASYKLTTNRLQQINLVEYMRILMNNKSSKDKKNIVPFNFDKHQLSIDDKQAKCWVTNVFRFHVKSLSLKDKLAIGSLTSSELFAKAVPALICIKYERNLLGFAKSLNI